MAFRRPSGLSPQHTWTWLVIFSRSRSPLLVSYNTSAKMQSTPGALWVLSLLTAISISSLSGGFSSSVFTCCCGMLRIKASCTESLSPNRLPKCSELHERMSFLSVRSFEPSDERRGRGACVWWESPNISLRAS